MGGMSTTLWPGPQLAAVSIFGSSSFLLVSLPGGVSDFSGGGGGFIAVNPAPAPAAISVISSHSIIVETKEDFFFAAPCESGSAMASQLPLNTA